jgi:cell wall-associated NlpC family hydrolase
VGVTARRISRLLLGVVLVVAIGGLGLVSLAGASTPAAAGTPAAPGTPVVPPPSTPGLLATNYWLASSQGSVWAFGSAGSYGSAAGLPLSHPVVAITPTPDGQGYWLVASDGGVFTFGDAPYAGSSGSAPAADPAEKLVPSPSGQGYWIEDQNGSAQSFGDAQGAPPVMGLMFQPVTAGDKAVLYAFSQLGKPYIWGGNGPVGYDCSGLALASWQHGAGVSFARVSEDQYHTAGQPVAANNLAAGDLVFWGTSQTDWTTVYHTAIYVGGDKIVESTDGGVQLNSLGQWGQRDIMPVGRRP